MSQESLPPPWGGWEGDKEVAKINREGLRLKFDGAVDYKN